MKMKKRLIGFMSFVGLALAMTSCDVKVDGINIIEKDIEEIIDNNGTTDSIILSAPTIKLDDKTVSWVFVENAEAFIVNINGTDLPEQTGTNYTLTESEAGDYVIKVKAITTIEGYKNSEYSSSVTISIKPSVIQLDSPVIVKNEKTISWENVSNATAYVVNINGVDLESQTKNSYTFDNETVGNYVIKVKALSNNESFTASEYSQSLTITIEEQEPSIVLNPTTLWVVGDSTVCSFSDNYYLPRYGYGTQLNNYLDSKVTIRNLAISGRSSRSFLSENNYQSLTDGIKSGDYLMIGFGHNDEKDDDESRYAAPTLDAKDIEKNNNDKYNFQYILNKYYIELAINVGATPILCTPIVRLNSSNNYSGSSAHITSTGNYVECIKDLGDDTNTTVIDLTTLTKNKYISLGYDEAKLYHAVSNCASSGSTIVPDYSSIDNTHINKYGAKEVSYLLTTSLKNTTNSLGIYVKANIEEPTKDVDYKEAINTNKTPTSYVANNWANYTPTNNMTTITKNSIVYNSTNVGYGWVGTVFGSCGSVNYKWYATETEEGTYKIGQSKTENNGSAAGKISSTDDGYAFLFSQIDANYNFKVTATLKVIETANTNQAAFGIMLRDDCYEPNKTNVTTNNVVAGLYCSSTIEMIANWSRETATLKKTNNKITGLYAVGDTAEISLTRLGQVVTCKIIYKGTTYETTYTDFDFQSVDSKYMYVGIIATRGTIVETSNLNLTITGISQGA